MSIVSADHAATYQADGVVLIKGLFADHIDTLRAGIARNMKDPGPYASTNDRAGETGLFFDDYCNWQRIPEFREVVHSARMIDAAATLMGSQSVQLFHDHVLVKEPGTSMATPWHQDGPYYFVQGRQTVSFWSPLDPVTSATLRCVAGSHRWPKDVVPTRWVSESAFFEGDYIPVPDPEAERMRIVEFDMEPGDAVAFHFRTLHGARGNHSDARRRAFSLRLVGDDARYVTRPGPTSPPFPGHEMIEGQRLRADWFPMLRGA